MTLREYHETKLDKNADIYLYDAVGRRIGVYNCYNRYPESHAKALLPCYGSYEVLAVTSRRFCDVAIMLDYKNPAKNKKED